MPCLKSVTIFLSNVPCFSFVLYQYSKISILHNSLSRTMFKANTPTASR